MTFPTWTPPPTWDADLPFSVERSNDLFGLDGNLDWLRDTLFAEDGGELTIASGVVTVDEAGFWTIDTEADATNDDLVTINGGEAGEIILIAPASGRLVTVKHGSGNIDLAGGEDVVLASPANPIMLRYNGTNWLEIGASRIAVWGMSLGSGSAVLDGSELGSVPYLPRVIPIGWYIEAPLESGSVTVDVKHGSFGGALSTLFSPSLTTAQTNNAALTPVARSAGSWHFDVNGAATSITQVSVIVIGVQY